MSTAGGFVRKRASSTSPLRKIAAAAGVGVLHVRRRVAVRGEHLVEVEHVVARAVLAQVGVLHRPDADRLGDVAASPPSLNSGTSCPCSWRSA